MIRLHMEKGRISVDLSAIPMGNDWCILLTGGDLPHLGAVSLSNGVTHAFPGHKEDAVTRRSAEYLRRHLNGNCAVCCGIHMDGITKGEISDVLALCDALLEKLVKQMPAGEV